MAKIIFVGTDAMKHSLRVCLAASLSFLLMAGSGAAFELSSFKVGAIVAMPKSNVGVAGRDDDKRPAMELNFQMNRRIARRAYEWGLTLALQFSDCNGQNVWVMDIFLDGESLYQSDISREAFELLYERTPKKFATVKSYIYKDLYDRLPHICVKAHGGNMIGFRSSSPEYTIK